MADDYDALKSLRSIFMDSYFAVDRERNLQDFNSTFVQMLDLNPGERRKLKGSKCYDWLKLEICKDKCIAMQCIEQDAPVRMQEIRGRSSAGRVLVVELSAVPLRNEQGETQGVLVTHRDVTDERRLKSRFSEEQDYHKRERSSLLRVIEERDEEIRRLKSDNKASSTHR